MGTRTKTIACAEITSFCLGCLFFANTSQDNSCELRDGARAERLAGPRAIKAGTLLRNNLDFVVRSMDSSVNDDIALDIVQATRRQAE